jgi:GTP-binding protein
MTQSTPPPLPKIALVGRPNVGKSTLFNRVTGRRQAITHGVPGSTRDRNYAEASWAGRPFEIVDTGGLLMTEGDPLAVRASDQAQRALDEANVLILVVDARAGLLPDDASIASDLRRRSVPVIVAVNKSEAMDEAWMEFASLGFDNVIPISAEHGQGVGDLLDLAVSPLPLGALQETRNEIRLALVGRPNVGKSSLLNCLVGEERAVVSEIPGTTRDALDCVVEHEGQRYRFVDTAGFRRRRLLETPVDEVSVLQARRSIGHCDVALLVLDAESGLREMDATVAGIVQEAGRGIVLVANKWDGPRVEGGRTTRGEFRERIHESLKFITHAPIIFTSARTRLGLTRLLGVAHKVEEACRHRVGTGPLNRVIEAAVAAHPPKASGGSRPPKILFAAQVGTRPPTFVISLNRPSAVHFSYKRFIENRLRAAFGFEGAPLVLRFKTRRH